MGSERLLHIVRLALKSIGVHRLRSSLTIMGIVLGVASVIVMLAVGEAARYQAIQQIKDLGATNLIIRSIKPLEEKKESEGQFILTYGITHMDAERIAETIPTVTSVTPFREFRREIRYLDRKLEARVIGVTPDFMAMNGLHLAAGRFIATIDEERIENVAVLGAETAEKLFPVDDPIGKAVRIGGKSFYKVIGITETRAPSSSFGAAMGAQDYNRDVYIPYESDRIRFGPVLMRFKSGSDEAERLEISQLTVAIDAMEHVRQTAEIISSLLEQYHTEKDTSIVVPLELLQKAEQTQRIFTLVLGAIASISLLVGGIGIMNIMLATVTERTREIGVRRALGAKRRDIAMQFLIETIVLSGFGGLLGVLLGIGISLTLTHFFAFQTIIRPWSPALAFSVSVAVGLIFGTYPARRAAMMDPIEALRHE
jgi:putative ABC transport system permease protein